MKNWTRGLGTVFPLPKGLENNPPKTFRLVLFNPPNSRILSPTFPARAVPRFILHPSSLILCLGGLSLLGAPAATPLPAVSDRILSEAEGKVAGGHPEEAAQLLFPLVQQELPAAQAAYGSLLLEGSGVPRDEAGARRLFLLAAEKGEVSGHFNYALVCDQGRGGERDPGKAFFHYRKAAEKGYPPAMHSLALCYAEGVGVARNDGETAAWLQKAADAGYAPAQHDLGVIWEEGRGRPANREEALRWHRRAAAQDFPASLYQLGRLTETRDTEGLVDAARWYRRAASLGHTEAAFRLGQLHYEGRGVPQDFSLAAEAWQLAADQGHPDALAWLGLLHQTGRGAELSGILAERLFRLSADAASATGRFHLAMLLLDQGKPAEARRLLETAAGQGHANAAHNLAVLLEQGGEGVSVDEKAAVSWYFASAKAGYAPAQLQIGNRLAKGRGLTKNLAEARRWWLAAARQGLRDAQFNLGEALGRMSGEGADPAGALMWLYLAHKQGDEDASQSWEKLRVKCDEATRQEAEKRVRDWLETRPKQL